VKNAIVKLWIATECSQSDGRHWRVVHVGHLTRQRKARHAWSPLRASPRGSIPVWGRWSLNYWSDSKGEVAKQKMKLKELSEDLQQREFSFLTPTRACKPDEYPYRKEFTTNLSAFSSGSVTLCCIVYYPIGVISKFWIFNMSQLKCSSQAFLCNFPPTLTLLLRKAWCSSYQTEFASLI